MILVFFRLPVTGAVGLVTPITSRAATATAEIANEIKWVTLN